MYEVLEIFTRANRKTPFFREASPDNLAMNDAYSAAEAAADGYRGRTDAETRDRCTFLVTTFWRDQPANDNFTAKAAQEFAPFLEARAAYYAANQIDHRVYTADIGSS